VAKDKYSDNYTIFSSTGIHLETHDPSGSVSYDTYDGAYGEHPNGAEDITLGADGNIYLNSDNKVVTNSSMMVLYADSGCYINCNESDPEPVLVLTKQQTDWSAYAGIPDNIDCQLIKLRLGDAGSYSYVYSVNYQGDVFCNDIYSGGDISCGEITSGAITCDSISTTSLSTDGDLTINSGQTLTVNGTLDVNDTLRLDGYDSLPRLIESGEDSSDGYASVRAFAPCDFFTDSDDADVSHNNTGGYITVRAGAGDDPLRLFKSLQNEWASGANIAYGWYLDYVWIYLDQSTSSGGPTSHASDYSVEAHLYKRGLAEGVPAAPLASKGIKDIDISPTGSIMTFDLSGVSDNDRKINWGDTLVLRVDLYKVDGSSGSLFKGALISGKEALLHP
jgi:hypothetical protein